MARTASMAVKLRRDQIANFCESNHPTTFKDVLSWAVDKGLPEMPKDAQRAEYTVRSDLHKLRQVGVVQPEWLVTKSDW